MEPVNLILLVFAFALALGVFVVYQKLTGAQPRAEDEDRNKMLFMLNENLNAVTKNMLTQMNEMQKQVSLRLKENADVVHQANKHVGDRLDSAAKVVSSVTERLGRLEEATKHIYEVGKDIATLQEILRSPKLRGNLGEQFLGDLLANLPKEMYELQYAFKNGKTVDAIIRFKEYIIPVDAKFPLENFQKFVAAENDKDKKTAKKAFIADVKKRIDEASAYIMPDEGTLEFALLYVPAENVYYEIIIKDDEGADLSAYARKKRVVPVSPNNFFVYLQTILMGLRGLQIERSAREIQSTLARLKVDFEKFGEDFTVLGTHLNNAGNKFDESEKRLLKIGTKLDQIELLSSEESAKKLLT